MRTEIIGEDSEGNIYVSIVGTLFKFNSKGELLRSFEIPANVCLSNMIQTQDGRIWLSAWDNRLMMLDKGGDKIKIVVGSPSLTRIAKSTDGKKIWMGTLNGEIYLFDPDSQRGDDKFKLFKKADNDAVLSLLQDDRKGNLWITTNRGLRKFLNSDSGFLMEDPIENDLLQGNCMLNEIIKDNKGDLWVSAFDRPTFSVRTQPFVPVHFGMEKTYEYFNNYATIIAMAKGKDDKIWFSQERRGLCLYDLAAEKSRSIRIVRKSAD